MFAALKKLFRTRWEVLPFPRPGEGQDGDCPVDRVCQTISNPSLFSTETAVHPLGRHVVEPVPQTGGPTRPG